MKFIQQNFYVDDGHLSLHDTDSAISVLKEAIDICKQGSVHLHKILSNSRAVVEAFSKTEYASSLQDLDLNWDIMPTGRTLGMMWDLDQDSFKYQVNMVDMLNTRRGVLSNVASVFDPLGLVSPVVLQGKSILQEICQKKLG